MADGPFRRPAHRRHGAAQRAHRRNGHRRGQDARRHVAAFSQRIGRTRFAPCHGQRLPGPPRRRVGRRDLPFPRSHRRCDPARPATGCAPRPIRLRHHLRHEQRVRLRLPARQWHGYFEGAAGAARTLFRDRRRSGLHPHRRGPHTSHHQRTRHCLDAPIRPLQAARRPDRPQTIHALQPSRHRGERAFGKRGQRGGRPRALQSQTRRTPQQRSSPSHGGARNAQAAR